LEAILNITYLQDSILRIKLNSGGVTTINPGAIIVASPRLATQSAQAFCVTLPNKPG
jgi:hypothetical protein